LAKDKVYDIVLRRRSVRRFRQKKVPSAVLRKLINAARLAPSASNLQPCEFIVVDAKEIVKGIFPTLRWAGYIHPQGNPPKGKEPVAYIVVLANKKKKPLQDSAEADAAAAIANIILVAREERVASCWLGSIDKADIRSILKIPSFCEIKYVVALGYPDERPKAERLKTSVRYWKDQSGRLHVPKRSLEEVLHRNKY
jgi:nitroreductase